MSTTNTIYEKLAIAGWEAYKAKRYGIKTCKPKMDIEYIQNLKEIYLFFLEKEACEEAISCYCTVERLEETINTL